MTSPLAHPAESTSSQLFLWGLPMLVAALAFVPSSSKSPSWPHWEVLVLAVLFVALFQLAPRRLRYRFTANGLEIRRLLGTTLLPYAGMQARRTAGRLGVRTFGTGLPGYLTGAFSFGPDSVPAVTALASVTSGGVLIGVPATTQASARASFVLASRPTAVAQPLRWYFLTPADPQQFLGELARRGAVVGQ